MIGLSYRDVDFILNVNTISKQFSYILATKYGNIVYIHETLIIYQTVVKMMWLNIYIMGYLPLTVG